MGDLRRKRAGSHGMWPKMGLAGVALCLTGALAACGGGDDEAAAGGGGGGNQAPTISGTPPSQAMQGQQYSFTPAANDPNGDTLTFTIAGTPAWAAFNASTGRLSGTPTSAQVGTYSNIRISVSDGTTTVNLPAFSITVVATATGSAMLTWNPPTQNTDGSPLNNLAGYRVYWGTSQGNLSNSATLNNPGLSSYLVDQLTPATWYFALSAVNSAGVESVGVVRKTTADSLFLLLDEGGERAYSALEIRGIDRRGDSLKNGLLIGAGLATLGALKIWAACEHPFCIMTGVYGIPLGALIGVLYDAMVPGRTTVYRAPPDLQKNSSPGAPGVQTRLRSSAR